MHESASNWLNVGSRTGYEVLREKGYGIVIRYHDFEKGGGRVPKRQEWFSLIGNSEEKWTAPEDMAVLVIFPNQKPEETHGQVERVQMETQENRVLCRLDTEAVTVEFAPVRKNKDMPYLIGRQQISNIRSIQNET